ncbi:hypothetical protein [Pelosinus fermentans]|uniref:hypothetical protein n=1 Tax=Pelosinus fermentans TaxID=365349 RepID=UPI0002D2CC79|nr:hypothetical protein [Pelosinus fermentans]
MHESVHSISALLIVLSSSASLVITPATYLIINYIGRDVFFTNISRMQRYRNA